MGQADNEY